MSVYVSKRQKAIRKIDAEKKTLPLKEAIQLLKTGPASKFDQSIAIQVKLGVDPAAPDQAVRGTTFLPHGQGKKLRVIVFTKDEVGKAARETGADEVGGDDLIEKVMKGWMDFDVVIATPSIMKEVGKLGKTLGPRGLMPSPKAGTVTDNPAKAVKEVKSGRVEFKMDKFANVNTVIGKLSFAENVLVDNGSALINSLVKAKPKTMKGVYIKSAHLSSTMGCGVRLDLTSFLREKESEE